MHPLITNSTQGFPSIFSVRNGVVREFKGRSRNEAALIAFARSDQGEGLSAFKSPFGPVGRVKGYLARAGFLALDFHAKMSNATGWTSEFTWLVIAFIGLISTLFGALGVAYFVTPSEQQHAHRD